MSLAHRNWRTVLVGLLLALSTSCGTNSEDQFPAELRDQVTSAASPQDSEQAIEELSEYVGDEAGASIDADLRADVADLLVRNISAVRETLADHDSPPALNTDPQALVALISETALDESSAKKIGRATNSSGLTETDKAVQHFMNAQPENEEAALASLQADLEDTARASGAIRGALPEMDDAEDISTLDLETFLKTKEPSALPTTPTLDLMDRSILLATYLHAPESALPSELADRPALDSERRIDAFSAWVEGSSAPITLNDVQGLHEYLESAWTRGIGD